MTRQEQYAQDLGRCANLIGGMLITREEFSGLSNAQRQNISEWISRLRNYGCLNPFRKPDKKVKKGKVNELAPAAQVALCITGPLAFVLFMWALLHYTSKP